MSDEEPGRTFISRWSRRKIAARQAQAVAPPVAAAPVPTPAAVPAEAVADEPATPDDAPRKTGADALPDVETLQGLQSEYREFLRPGVDESLRRTALKKLFADPHFNVMDGLDVYIDDYSKPDPIPAALLRSLNQARGLKLFDDEERGAEAAGSPPHVAPPQAGAAEELTERRDAPVGADVSSTDCRVTTESTVSQAIDGGEERKNG